MYYNISENLCRIFVGLCVTCCIDCLRVVQMKDTATPIISTKYCDRYQADLIDFRNAPALLYPGVVTSPICLWLLVLKDHFSRFVVLRPLMNKSALHVAVEIDFICSIIGYPCVFQTDNGGEFKKELLACLKNLNPFMYSVKGRPRTPKQQGSVKRSNSTIKSIIARMVFHLQNTTEDVKEKK